MAVGCFDYYKMVLACTVGVIAYERVDKSGLFAHRAACAIACIGSSLALFVLMMLASALATLRASEKVNRVGLVVTLDVFCSVLIAALALEAVWLMT